MRASDDAIELLLPDVSEEVRARARRLTSFLRLLVDDAHAVEASRVGIDLPRARLELDTQRRVQLESTLRDLLRHHLEVAIPADSFFWIGEPAAPLQTAWSTLEELRAHHAGLPGVPEPGEGPMSVAARILTAFESSFPDHAECEHWRARWLRLAQGPRAGEQSFRLLYDRALNAGSIPALRSALTGMVECQLDRGAVREARQLLLEQLPRAGATTRLRVLFAWARLCQDDAAGARSLLLGVRPWAGPLPRALAELRERRREWLPMLTGRARGPAAIQGAPLAGVEIGGRGTRWLVGLDGQEPMDLAQVRGSMGASVAAAFAFHHGGGARCLGVDVAVGLRARAETWIAECETIASIPGSLAHRMLVEARSVTEARSDEQGLPGVLGGELTRSAFLEPVLDEEGEVAGWVHAEFEHHLIPSAERRACIAAAWRERFLRDGARTSEKPSSSRASKTATAASPIQERCFEALVNGIGIKTSQRLWWGFDLVAGTPELVARGGAGQGFPPETEGKQRGLLRALNAGGPVHFGEPDERLSVHGGASSGAVLHLRWCGRTTGLLALESCRRRDFRAADVPRLQASLDRLALLHRTAQFREWHALRFGHDVWFDAEEASFAEFARRLILAARTEAPVLVAGPAGAGKLVLARWIHFESARGSEPLRVTNARGVRDGSALRQQLDLARGGTCIIDGLEHLAPDVQGTLLEWIEDLDVRREAALAGAPGSSGTPRLILTLDPEAVPSASLLRCDLLRRLDRLRIALVPLRDRRDDIVPLVECLAQRFASETGDRPPAFSEDALALFWRQPWPGNVRELESLVYKLVLFSRELGLRPSRELEAEQVLEIAGQSGVELLRRIPSRHPRRVDLLAAIRISRTRRGRVNKTRAGVFLGWDPDTFVARLTEAGISEEDLGELTAKEALDPLESRSVPTDAVTTEVPRPWTGAGAEAQGSTARASDEVPEAPPR